MLNWIQSRVTDLRYWLIRKLSCGDTIILRAQIMGGTLYLSEDRSYVAHTVVTDSNPDFCKTEA